MTENCPTCNRPMPANRAITVEYATGEYVDSYWIGTDYWGKTAMEAALGRIRHLKNYWKIDARIRENDG